MYNKKHLTLIVRLSELENVDTGAYIQGVTPGYEKIRICLDDSNVFRIGRGRNVELSLHNPAVSQLSCLLLRNLDNSYSVMDISSKNGTYINGVQVKEARLEDGDTIWIGTVEFEYRCGGNGIAEDIESFKIEPYEIEMNTDSGSKFLQRLFWGIAALSTIALGLSVFLLLSTFS